MSMDITQDATTYNQSVIDRIGEGVEKVAMELGSLVRDKILDAGLARSYMTLKDVDRNTPGMQESDTTDTMYFLAHSERLGYAQRAVIRGNGTARLFHSKKFKIGFARIETEHFVTDDAQIKMLSYPFTDDVEKKFPVFIQFVEDREMLLNWETMVQTQQQWANAGGGGAALGLNITNIDSVKQVGVVKGDQATQYAGDDFKTWFLQKSDFAALARLFPGTHGQSLRGVKALISERDAHSMLTWQNEDIGSEKVGDVAVNGWKYSTIGGFEFKKSNQTSLLRPGNVYMVAGEEFGGLFLRFIDTKMAMDRHGDRLEMWAWEMVGMGWGNILYVKKLELFGGSATPGYFDAGYADVLPMSEEQMLQENIPDYETTPGSFVPSAF